MGNPLMRLVLVLQSSQCKTQQRTFTVDMEHLFCYYQSKLSNI